MDIFHCLVEFFAGRDDTPTACMLCERVFMETEKCPRQPVIAVIRSFQTAVD